MPKVVFRTGKRTIGGKAELFIRFYYGAHENCRAASGIFVPVDSWSDKDQRLLYKSRAHTQETSELVDLNRRIEDLRTHIENAYMSNPYIQSSDWLIKQVALFYDPKKGQHKRLGEICLEYAEKKKVSNKTVVQYKIMDKLLAEFEAAAHPILVDEFTVEDIEDFEKFLSANHSPNTVISKMRKLRAASHWAVTTGRCDTDPFMRYEIGNETYGDPISLTREERDRLYAFDDLTPKEIVQRDIFIFHTYVGCRVSDLITLTSDNITEDGCIQYIPYKMRRTQHSPVIVPLSDVAKEIIERYDGSDPKGRLLPFITPQKYNDMLKSIAKKAGLTRHVIVQDKMTMESKPVRLCDIISSHIARKTFSDLLFEVTESDTIVASLTGHSLNSSALDHYRKVKRETQRDAIEKLTKKQ